MSDNPYGAPQHMGTMPSTGLPSKQPPSTGLAVTSMVLGIVAIVINCCCTLLGAALGIAAIITGFIALNKVKDGTGAGKGMAMAGLICGIIAVVLGIGLLILSLVINVPNIMQEIQRAR